MEPAAASRLTGVAPLSVFFNADLELGAVDRTFRDNYYYWEFDDSGAGTWANGKDKDFAIGACANHVFESAGTFSVTCKTYSSTLALIGTDAFEVTVTDPDTVFPTTATICISDTAQDDFVGKPTGALEVTTDDLATALETHLGAGKRVLLNRGAAWTTTSTLSLPTGEEGIYLGAYGTGTNEDAWGIFDNAPSITTTNTSDFIDMSNRQGIRLLDLKFTGSTSSGASILGGSMNLEGLLAHKLDTTGFDIPINWTHWRNGAASTDALNMSIVSCRLDAGHSYGAYIGAENLTFMGNKVSEFFGHAVRVWWADKGVIEHSDISGSTAGSAHTFKMHGPAEDDIGDYASTGSSGLPTRTQFAIISNNIFGQAGAWYLSIGPQSTNDYNERLQDIIIERNLCSSQHGRDGTTDLRIFLKLSGHNHTVRNNIFDLTKASPFVTGISIGRHSIEWEPEGIDIYNNTIYRGDDGGAQTDDNAGIGISEGATDMNASNNLVSSPYATGDTWAVRDSSVEGATLNNNVLTDMPYLADPDNVDPLLRDFSLTAASTASIGQGYQTPVYDDFDGARRAAPYDIGAYVYEVIIVATFHKANIFNNSDNKYVLPEVAELIAQDLLESGGGFFFIAGVAQPKTQAEIVAYASGKFGTKWCPNNLSLVLYSPVLTADQNSEFDTGCNQ